MPFLGVLLIGVDPNITLTLLESSSRWEYPENKRGRKKIHQHMHCCCHWNNEAVSCSTTRSLLQIVVSGGCLPAQNPSLSQSQELETQLPYTDYFSKNVEALLRYTPDTLDTYNGHFPFFHGTPIKMNSDGTSLVEDLVVIKVFETHP